MIPKVFHFVFGLAEDFGGMPFSFVHYMAVKSAVSTNPAFRAKFYCKFVPKGIFWDIAQQYLEVVEIEPPSEIFGNPLCHVAHMSDVVRLRCLLEQGGIYLDLDTITVKSLAPLLTYTTVLGVEAAIDQTVGLCNAIILAEPGAPFIRRWLESYKSFRSKGRDQFWDEHSVKVPLRLALEHPGDVTTLDQGAFFYPNWEEVGLRDLFIENKRFPAAYCHHLWESYAWHLMRSLDERIVMNVDTSYNVLARQYLGTDLERFRVARARELELLLVPPIRVNLGCGSTREPGWLNVDQAPESSPDMIWDLTQPPWPLPDHSVGEARLSHILEHLGDRLRVVFQELYRVCADRARVHIRVPHPRHDWFLTDPTHNRPLLPESFEMLDLEKCRRWQMEGDTKTPLAVYWHVDFELVEAKYVLDPALLKSGGLIGAFSELLPWRLRRVVVGLNRRLARLFGKQASPLSNDAGFSRHMSNIFGDIQVVLVARKSPPVGTGSESLSSTPTADVIDVRLLLGQERL